MQVFRVLLIHRLIRHLTPFQFICSPTAIQIHSSCRSNVCQPDCSICLGLVGLPRLDWTVVRPAWSIDITLAACWLATQFQSFFTIKISFLSILFSSYLVLCCNKTLSLSLQVQGMVAMTHRRWMSSDARMCLTSTCATWRRPRSKASFHLLSRWQPGTGHDIFCHLTDWPSLSLDLIILFDYLCCIFYVLDSREIRKYCFFTCSIMWQSCITLHFLSMKLSPV